MGYDGSTGVQAKLQVKGDSTLSYAAIYASSGAGNNTCQISAVNKAIVAVASGTDWGVEVYS